MAALAAALLAVAVVPAFAAKIEIESLSNRPDKVSGGDMLIRVRVPEAVALGDVKVKLNNADVTGGLFQDPASHALMGLVTGLKNGNNTINASANKTNPGALAVVNYPIQGPVFSGPQEKPFYCQTHQFRVYAGGPFFSAAQLTDPCVEATRVDYLYRNTATPGAFVALPAGPLPADLRMTTTTTGEMVPYIIRLETGVINRSIYQIAILDDPSVAGPDLQNHTDPGWNNRLIYTFGGGCGGGHYIQGSSTGGVLNDAMLSRGFAVASGSLNVLGNNCNFVTSAETLMMVKEHFIETFGPPLYTMGFGCSGGSIQQHLIGDNYPGLLDGLTPSCSFPDVAGATTFDARLLYDYYNFKTKGVTWTEDQIRQVSGFGTYGHIVNQGTSWAARIDPVPNRPNYLNAAFSWLYNNVVPVDVRYVPDPAFPNSPLPNPTGARATTWDHVVNLLGEGANGFARRPLDNVGIQYGLGALNAGQISKEQFLDLNEKIGGLDIDANFTKQRMVADANALRAAYQTGFVTNFGFGLANVPILDWDQIYSDLNPGGDVHMKFHHFSVRERLKKANGNADNQVIWTGGDGTRSTFVSTQVVLQMDAWLTTLKADTSSDPAPVKVVRAKPATLVDGCWMGSGTPPNTPTFTAEPQIFGGVGTSVCNTDHPAFPFPRYVAGAPLTIDIIKCQLRAIKPTDYVEAFTPAEMTRLRAIFPTGVCDWSKPGVAQTDPISTWITYTGVGTYNRDKK